ncbi:MAG: serine hydrolase domain-containing protein [Actinomycetes bacterium]
MTTDIGTAIGDTIDAAAVERLLARARRDIDEGLLPSAQVALAINGEIVVEETFGAATPESRYCVFSSTKPFIASCCWILIQEGKLDVTKRVVDYIPEFGTNGKEVVTVEQVMLHQSGFPSAPLGPPQWETKAGRLEAFGKWRLQWEPGTISEYHPSSAHWVLAEIIERLSGEDFRDFLERRVTSPLGLPRVLGVTDDAPVMVPVPCGEPATADELEAVLGIRELPATEVTTSAVAYLSRYEARAVGLPGGGGVMRARDLALFYQALLHNSAGIWDPEVLSDGTGRVRSMLPDAWTGVPASRTLGLVTAGSDGLGSMRGFGKTTSPRTFGHNGAFGQISWADPETGISFAYVTDGLDEHILRQGRRGIALSSLANECAK